MNVLSLFDGISCAKVALNRANITVNKYYSSEIDKYTIEVSSKNHPDIKHIGNVKDISQLDINIDILIGGSPCQDLSVAKKNRKGLEGDRSSLFWEYVRIKNLCQPKWFILENVASMKKEDKDTITKALGVEPIMIDASLVSAQSRKRLFWSNIPIALPQDKDIKLKDILMTDVANKYYIKGHALTANGKQTGYIGYIGNSNAQANRVYNTDNMSVCLSANGGGLGAKSGLYKIDDQVRRLTPIECERLQGLTDNYTEGISDTQRYKCLGNAFNVDVISHILRAI
jgi:DNA (cytosine-5)-methyltransferase 3A